VSQRRPGAGIRWRPAFTDFRQKPRRASGPDLARIELIFRHDALVALEGALDAVLELTVLRRQQPYDFVLALCRGYPHSVEEIYFLTNRKFVVFHELNIGFSKKPARKYLQKA
jgi:hypothetical protein